MKISVITPIYLADEDQRRRELFDLCIESIKAQDFDKSDVEHIIINDGSPTPFAIPDYPWIKLIDQPNLQRILAYEKGLSEARGDIICMLDSDDQYEPYYLSKVASYFKNNKKYKMFNFGATMIYADGGEVKREPFRPKILKHGHEIFGGGKIINGTFAFHRKIYEDLGGFPNEVVINDVDCTDLNYGGVRPLTMLSPYDFSAYAQVEFPEIRQFFMVNHAEEPEHKIIKELGNPFGNDYYLFYKYTRKYHSLPMEDYLLRVNLKL
jgi:glycosyltransferase involved in cell wall biosynthesis